MSANISVTYPTAVSASSPPVLPIPLSNSRNHDIYPLWLLHKQLCHLCQFIVLFEPLCPLSMYQCTAFRSDGRSSCPVSDGLLELSCMSSLSLLTSNSTYSFDRTFRAEHWWACAFGTRWTMMARVTGCSKAETYASFIHHCSFPMSLTSGNSIAFKAS